MVRNITNLSRSGLCDWLLQRVSAIVLILYTFIILGYIYMNPEITYYKWHMFMSQTWMCILTSLSLLSIIMHAWIGMWTITTDYLNTHCIGKNSLKIRFPIQCFFFLFLFSYLFWGAKVIWGY